ncbi:hypothetical protein M2317_000056 [Microbacterium sp. ZKA21]|uniref:hypothetical protein n=1 Tax=Microbacterium sp. ZKA21 TaxID=3381694 RepID=UPI003D2159E5
MSAPVFDREIIAGLHLWSMDGNLFILQRDDSPELIALDETECAKLAEVATLAASRRRRSEELRELLAEINSPAYDEARLREMRQAGWDKIFSTAAAELRARWESRASGAAA